MALGTPVAGAAAYSAQNGTTVSPAYPAGILATDIVLLFTGQKPSTANGGTVTTPAGWTLREELLAAGGYGTTLGADTGNTNLRVYSWDTPVAGQTGTRALTLATNNISWAFIVRIPTGGGTVSYGSADGQQTTQPLSLVVGLDNGTTATNFQAGDKAIWAMCIPTDVTTPAQFSAHSVTATGATFATATEINEPDSATGNDIGGFSAYAHVDSGSSTTAPTISATVAGTRTNVRGPIVMVRLREAPVAQDLTPSLYTNDQTFYGPDVTQSGGVQTLTPGLYTNNQTFFSAAVTQTGGGQSLNPNLYTNGQTFFAPTVTATRALTPNLYTNEQTFYSATVAATRTLTPSLYSNSQTFYAPTVSTIRTLAPLLYTNGQTFFAATVTATRALTPDRYTNDQTFFSATVAPGAVTLTPGLYTNDQTFFAAVVAQAGGPQPLTPNLYTNAQTFYAATVTRGAVALLPSLYTNGQTFFAAAATATRALAPSLYTNGQTFYAAAATATRALTPGLYTNAQTFYAATVTASRTLTPALYTNGQTFFTPTVAQADGTQTLAPQGYVDDGFADSGYIGPNTFSTQVFYGATVTSVRALQPPLTSNVSLFFAASVQPSLYTISNIRANLIFELALLHGLVPGNPLTVSATSRSAGSLVQTITGTDPVTVTKVSSDILQGNLDDWIDALAAVHGLTAPLVVTPTSRSSGSLNQTLGNDGTTTTVTTV